MTLADKTLVCRECGAEFLFTVGEQEFYREKGFLHEPTRCPGCRSARRAGGGMSSGPRRMHPVVCAECGAQTEVPFEPRGDRPVYCRTCFENRRARGA